MPETTLHCTRCWWSTPPGKQTHCAQCAAPLHLPDGRRVIDVMVGAGRQAHQFAAAGQNPAAAPAVGEAAALLRRPTRFADWIFVVRVAAVAAAVVYIAVFLLMGLTGRNLASVPFISSTSASDFRLLCLGLATFTALVAVTVTWLADIAVVRTVILALGVLGFASAMTGPSLAVAVVAGTVDAVLAGTALMSLVTASPTYEPRVGA